MELLRTIVRCPNIQQCYSTGQGTCCKIIAVQSSFPAMLCQHHVPEPWSGDIEHAPILFLGPNPGIDKANIPPGKQAKFPLWGWKDEETEEFFTQRYNQDKDKPWILGGTRYLLQDNTHSKQEVIYWVSARALAKEALGRDIHDGVDYALTEVVHCQSKTEKAIGNETRNECVKRYLQPVLALSGAKVLVVLGSMARLMMEGTFKAALNGAYMFPNGRAVGPVQISGRQRYIAYLPHPNWCRRFNKPCTFEQWLDKEAFQALQAFLRKQ